MRPYHPSTIPGSEITSESSYFRRRDILRMTAAGGLALAAPSLAFSSEMLEAKPGGYDPKEELTPEKDVTSYNNFYEFGTGKSDPAAKSGDFNPRPWSIKVDGLVGKPAEFDLDALMALGLEERIYRMRCVEAWSMVIPWIGFPLAALLDKVDPLGSAKYVAFETVVRPEEMPGQRGLFQPLNWPYVEGLRLDEARHPLAILALGLYGKTLPNQNGVEIWLQGHQVDRPHHADRRAAGVDMEQACAGRIRILRQRQSGRRSSALEPGDGKPHWRRWIFWLKRPANSAVQRLRR